MADNLLSSRESAVIYLTAQGKGANEVAEAIGCSRATVTKMVSSERVQFEIKRMRHKLFGKDSKDIQRRFDAMVPKAIETLEEILENPNVKPQLRFSAAQEAFDRSLGKPKQTMEVKGSLISELFDRLDQKPVVDLGGTYVDEEPKVLENPNKAITIDEPKKEIDPVDAWVEKNI